MDQFTESVSTINDDPNLYLHNDNLASSNLSEYVEYKTANNYNEIFRCFLLLDNNTRFSNGVIGKNSLEINRVEKEKQDETWPETY